MTIIKTNVKNGIKVGYFNSYIISRIRANKNFICCITGQTGSGKSYAALREGEILDSNFDISNVCFSPEEFMDLVNGKTKQLNRGSVIVFDEVQVTMSALDFQSLQARLINSCLQTFRYMGFILFMTSPYFSFINKSARKLFHSRWETISIDRQRKVSTLKPFLLQTNQDTGDTYKKYLRIHTSGYGLAPITSIECEMPSEQLLNAYEEKRQKFSRELNEGISRDLDKLKNKNKPKELTEPQKELISYLKDGFTIKQVAERLNVNIKTLYERIEYIKKKGVNIRPIREKNVVKRYEVTGM